MPPKKTNNKTSGGKTQKRISGINGHVKAVRKKATAPASSRNPKQATLAELGFVKAASKTPGGGAAAAADTGVEVGMRAAEEVVDLDSPRPEKRRRTSKSPEIPETQVAQLTQSPGFDDCIDDELDPDDVSSSFLPRFPTVSKTKTANKEHMRPPPETPKRRKLPIEVPNSQSPFTQLTPSRSDAPASPTIAARLPHQPRPGADGEASPKKQSDAVSSAATPSTRRVGSRAIVKSSQWWENTQDSISDTESGPSEDEARTGSQPQQRHSSPTPTTVRAAAPTERTLPLQTASAPQSQVPGAISDFHEPSQRNEGACSQAASAADSSSLPECSQGVFWSTGLVSTPVQKSDQGGMGEMDQGDGGNHSAGRAQIQSAAHLCGSLSTASQLPGPSQSGAVGVQLGDTDARAHDPATYESERFDLSEDDEDSQSREPAIDFRPVRTQQFPASLFYGQRPPSPPSPYSQKSATNVSQEVENLALCHRSDSDEHESQKYAGSRTLDKEEDVLPPREEHGDVDETAETADTDVLERPLTASQLLSDTYLESFPMPPPLTQLSSYNDDDDETQ